jgi:flagella basal body P-ring formation protein FlgA
MFCFGKAVPARSHTRILSMKFAPLALLFVATPAAAQDFQSTRMLDTIVAQFTGHEIGQEGGARAPVDVRLKLAVCSAPQLSWRTEGHDAVLVRCMAPEWRIFVPVLAPPPAAKPVVTTAAPTIAVPQMVRPAPIVKAEPVIRRGDAVTLEAGAAGFSITREGVAMNDAPAGGRVMIKVDENKSPIQAVAVEAGHARLPGSND